MSASKDKLLRKQQIEAGTDKRTNAAAKEKAAHRKSMITYTLVAVLLVVFFAFIFIYNSSWPSRHFTAVPINDQEYSVAELNYYYSASYLNFTNTYSNYINYGVFFDPNTSLGDQEYSEGYTWRQYFLDTAVSDMAQIQMLCDQAEANGFTLSEEQQAAYDSEVESLHTSWSGLGYSSLAQFINMNYGKGVTEDMVVEQLYRSHLASAYAQSIGESYEYATAQLDDYYASVADDMDVIGYAYYTIPQDDETLDAQAMADELNGTDADAFTAYLAENAEDAEPTVTHTAGSGLNSAYSEWLLDDARAAGDTTAIETDSATYVVMFLDRDKNDYPLASFRHILVQAEDTDGDGTISDEEIKAAADEAESIYTEWKNGDATEDSFAALANERSDDGGSNTNGGLYEDVSKYTMVDPINDWLFAKGRKSGDTTVVSYDGANYTGTHVLYYVGSSDMTYARTTADAAMRNDAYNAWVEEQMANYQPVTSHLGMAGKNH